MSELRPKANAVVLGGLGFILGLILLRFLVTLGGLSAESLFTQLIIGLTNPLVIPFDNIYRLAQVGSFVFDLAALISFFVILVIGILFHDIVLAIFQEDHNQVTSSVVNILFKYIEFIFIARIILKLLGVVGGAGTFSSAVYGLTNWSAYVFPPVTLFNGVVEVSAVIFLLIFIAIDVFTERIVAAGVLSTFLDQLIGWINKLNMGFGKLSLPTLTKPAKPVETPKAVVSAVSETTSTIIPVEPETIPTPVAPAVPAESPIQTVAPTPVAAQPEVAPNAFSNAVLEVEEIQNVQNGK